MSLYKRIARTIFINAFHDELCEVGKEIRIATKKEGTIENYKEHSKALGKIDVLEKLELLA